MIDTKGDDGRLLWASELVVVCLSCLLAPSSVLLRCLTALVSNASDVVSGMA